MEVPGPVGHSSSVVSFPGEYRVRASGVPVGFAHLEVTNGRLTLDWCGSGPLFLNEKAPGIFFSCTGEALDLVRDPPTYANIPLTRPR